MAGAHNYNEDLVLLHRSVNATVQQRLKAFDRRFLRRTNQTASDDMAAKLSERSGRGSMNVVAPERMSFLKNLSPVLHYNGIPAESDYMDFPNHSEEEAFEPTEEEDDTVDEDDAFVELPPVEDLSSKDAVMVTFQIVGCSSEKLPYVASGLRDPGAHWEASGKSKGEEYVVAELDKPGCVAALSFALPGDDSGPCRCSIEYSTMSPVGPWTHAWDFEVTSKASLEFKAEHSYMAERDTKDFQKLCSQSGTVSALEETWREFFDIDGVGSVEYQEFHSGCRRFRDHLEAVWGQDGPWQETLKDPRRIFTGLDVHRSGKVCLKDLKIKRDRWPEAQWWKLIVRSNFGSSKRIQVVGPLQIFVIPKEEDHLRRRRGSIIQSSAEGASLACATAFNMDQLELSGETIVSRRLSRKLTIPIPDVEVMHHLFHEHAKEVPGVLSEPEFRAIVHRIAGVKAGQIRDMQIKFFWQVADADSSGNVDFEELLMWIKKYAADIPCLDSVRRCRLSLTS